MSDESLSQIWTRLGGLSDKATRHSYIDFYETLFAGYRDAGISYLEIGVGGGDCLKAWDAYFGNATICGLDLYIYEKNPDFHLVSGDATSHEVWKENFSGEQFDIIVDDASHAVEDQLKTFFLYRDLLKNNGLYVIEDVCSIEVARLFELLGFTTYDRREIKQCPDDILSVWKR